MITRVKTKSEIAAMRESGRMLATVLELLRKKLQPGMSTKDLAVIAGEELESSAANPVSWATRGFRTSSAYR
jgi:methionyl aminopeptidase